MLLRRILTSLPLFPLAFLIAAIALTGFMWPSPNAGVFIVLDAAALAATLASMFGGEFGGMPIQRRVVTVVCFTLTVALAGTIAWLLFWRGFEKDLTDAPLSKQPKVAALDIPDPGQPGPLRVLSASYGPGADRHRPEYGAGVSWKSRTVDGSKLFTAPDGWQGKLYSWYWGFDAERMPLNARLWYPDAPGKFPLVLIVHGNHLAQDFSDPGYAYLGELLASRGYIVASIDENFINSSWTGGLDQKETAARGWLLLEHLKLFREWNAAAGHRLAGRIDLDRIALMGHSRGGEAVATAALFNRLPAFPGDATQRFDYNFNIRSIVAIAPADGQYKPAGVHRPLKDVSYFVIQGGYDADVSAFDGSRQFNRVSFSPEFEGFKSELWIYRANHGQFNTVWGDDDNGPPGGWLLNKKPLLTGEAQRQIGRVYFSAFLDATLKDDARYRDLFRDYRAGARWLPDTTYLNRYADAHRTAVADFDEDLNVDTATLAGASIRGEKLVQWKENRTELRWGDRGENSVSLGWRDPAAMYAVTLPAEFSRKLSPESNLVFDYSPTPDDPPDPEAKKKEKDKDKGKDGKKKDEPKKDDKKKAEEEKNKPPLDFTVELLTADGKIARLPLSAIGPLFKPMRTDYVKLSFLGFGRDTKPIEPVLQRYAVPLKNFPGLASSDVREIRFHFDRSKMGVILLDNIGFEGKF